MLGITNTAVFYVESLKKMIRFYPGGHVLLEKRDTQDKAKAIIQCVRLLIK